MGHVLNGSGRRALSGLFAVLAAGALAAIWGGGRQASAVGARGGLGPGTGTDLVHIYCAGFLDSGFLGLCVSNSIAGPPRPGNFDPHGR